MIELDSAANAFAAVRRHERFYRNLYRSTHYAPIRGKRVTTPNPIFVLVLQMNATLPDGRYSSRDSFANALVPRALLPQGQLR
jgi:hypothetical protein